MARPIHKTLYSQQYRALLVQLRALREAQGVTQMELARRLSWSQDNISKVETGLRRLDVIELKLWLEALDSTLAAFVASL